MSALVEVPFYGDTLQACREGETVSVVIKRVCDALGIAQQAQLSKLKGKPWAVVTMSVATASDGKNYEVACLNLDALPMWLATIEPNRVSESARPKLVAYQTECARVLRDHFYGRAPQTTGGMDAQIVARFEAMLAPVIATMGAMAKTIQDISGATITHQQWVRLRSEVKIVATLRSRANPNSKGASSEYRTIYNKLGSACAWTGSGRTWHGLPASKVADALATLAEMRRDAERAQPDRQLSLLQGGA